MPFSNAFGRHSGERRNSLFEYSRWPVKRSQIRVLEILSGENTDPILCDINLLDLDDNDSVPYTALSYVWGKPIKTRYVLVRGKRFDIQENLWEALSHLRPARGPALRLWVDAVCINQQNIPERNHQVQQMGTIYNRASNVIAWIGSGNESSDAALRYIEMDANSGEELSSTMLSEQMPFIWDILKREYFQRLWVFQEIALAKSCVLVCGHSRMDFESLLQYSLLDNIWEAATAVNRYITQKDQFDRAAQVLSLLRNLWHIRTDHRAGKHWPLASLVVIVRGQSCVDPRDHIYGVNGIAKFFGRRHEAVDYEREIEHVYSSFTRSEMVHLLEGTNLLSFVGMDLTDNTSSNHTWRTRLPSWVPDWSQWRVAERFHYGPYAAGGKDNLKIVDSMFSHQSQFLTLEGFVCDTIHAITETYDSQKFTGEYCLQWEQFVQDSGTSQYGDYNEKLNAFWRTLIGDVAPGEKRWPKEERGAAYNVFTERASPIGGSSHLHDLDALCDDFTRDFRISLGRALKGRNLMLSQQGSVGLVTAATRPGDELVIFYGIPTPFVIRKRPSSDRYQLVAQAYVHGIMDGEAMEHQKTDQYEGRSFVFD